MKPRHSPAAGASFLIGDLGTTVATFAGFGSVAFTPAQFYLSHMLQRALPGEFVAPCLPTKTDKLPSGSQWLHEIKHDGFRIIARKNGAQVRLYSRPGNDLTREQAHNH